MTSHVDPRVDSEPMDQTERMIPLPGEPLPNGVVSDEPAVVYVDADDDVGSIREKLDHSDRRRVVLVVPREAKALRSPVRLKLLKRNARYLAKDMVLIAEDGWVRRLAKEEGFAVARSLKGVKFRGPASNRPIAWPSPSRAGIVVSSVLVIALILVGLAGAAIALPTATIELKPVNEAASEPLIVKASRQAKTVTLEDRLIPGRQLQAEAEVTSSVETTGKKSASGDPAKGRIEFTNRTGSAVQVPKGTQVRTVGDVRFATDDDVTVGTGNQSRIDVGITAVEGGTTGNVPPNTIARLVDNDLDAKLGVTNPLPTAGGNQKETSFVTLADRNRLRGQVLDKLRDEGYARLYDTKRPGESLYRESVSVTVVEEVFDHQLDEQSPTVALTSRAKVTAVAFDGKDILELGNQFVRARLAPGRQVLPNSLTVAPGGIGSWDDETIMFQVTVNYKTIPVFNESQIRSTIAGQNKDDAAAYLSGVIPLQEPPAISIWPSVLGVLPQLSGRIEIKLIG